METPLPHLGLQCEGTCRQTCTVKPIIVDSCNGAGVFPTGSSLFNTPDGGLNGEGHYVEVIKLRDENGKLLFDIDKLEKLEPAEKSGTCGEQGGW